jgi:hypothetical protein
MKNHASACAVLVVIVTGTASAQTWPVGLTSTLQFGFPTVGPAPLGGMTFDATGTQLLLVGGAGATGATAYAHGPIRHPGTGRITGLGSATPFGLTPNADGGLALHGGLLWWAKYPTHQVAQLDPVTGLTATTALPAAWSTTGGLTFVPPGYPNAGELIVSSYSYGSLYSFPIVPAGNGFFNLGPATLYATMPQFGSEGLAFVSSGPLAGHLLVANYTYGKIAAIPIAPSGLPVGGAATPVVLPVIDNLSGAEGIAIDPLTGDLFVSSYNTSILFRIDGFTTFTPLASDYPFVSAGAGATVEFFVRAGSANALRGFALAASGSGTVPGTQIGLINVPLNVDVITDFVIINWNTPLLTNFVGTTDITGAAVATVNIPPILLGAPISVDFAGALLSPVDFATNAVHLNIVP